MRKLAFTVLCILALACSDPAVPVSTYSLQIMEVPDRANAGEQISLDFKGMGKGRPILFLRNSLGQSVLEGRDEGERLRFTLPGPYSKKSGPCHWSLVLADSVLRSGVIEIQPLAIDERIETYLGPRNVIAGPVDHTMLVTVPSDKFGNPMPDGTVLELQKQISEQYDSKEIQSGGMLAWDRIYAEEKASRAFLSVSAAGSTSKELTYDIHPALPEDFEIEYARFHPYADGNQVITFSTSTLKDTYGNIVSDGTMVSFSVIDADGKVLRTQGTTLNGVAEARMLHPDRGDTWTVTAHLAGVAGSQELEVEFLPVIRDFDLEWKADSRTVVVGPVDGFLDQFQPDGLRVTLTLFNEKGVNVMNRDAELSDGYAGFDLGNLSLSAGRYLTRVEIGGQSHEMLIELTDEDTE
ncbi:Ig-like domain-containing protein [Muriicola marianensis]|uniref:Big-1 domain-containing protein n=1 Tax=Muriicola marianensis TaxID=1324801 RepID=A0ABQ1QQZ0_9FLAO|nr:Ig-like domain-containing protein [Muriicola marianensis]GGD41620.1 hypothetical protein GCM10011361_05870 [Muriicola marianensis]